MMFQSGFIVFPIMLVVAVGSNCVRAAHQNFEESPANGLETKALSTDQTSPVQTRSVGGDLATAETSAKLFDLSSLFGHPSNGYGNGYGNNGYGNRPTYNPYPGYYPNTGTGYYGGYYPSTSGGGYYPSTSGGGYYPSTSGGGYYPSTSGGSYYPNTYSQAGVGTNMLGGIGGYGGYGGNGGLRQYSGYQDSAYNAQRNRGYGYTSDTDRYGLPPSSRGNQYGSQYGNSDRSYGYNGRD